VLEGSRVSSHIENAYASTGNRFVRDIHFTHAFDMEYIPYIFEGGWQAQAGCTHTHARGQKRRKQNHDFSTPTKPNPSTMSYRGCGGSPGLFFFSFFFLFFIFMEHSTRIGRSTTLCFANPPSRMKVRLLFFAAARELVGEKEVELDLEPGTNSSSVLSLLASRWPKLDAIINSCILAVNQEYTDSDSPTTLREGSSTMALCLVCPI
jgi:molybdopterin converting factor small subunit